MILKGKYYDGKNADSRDVKLRLADDGYVTIEPDRTETLHIQDINISRRIGNTPRSLRFPDGGMFETQDNDRLDGWLERQGIKTSWAHRLEKNLHFAIGALVSVILIAVWFSIWGIPILSTWIAYELPPEINNYIGQGALQALDKRIFKESGLDENTRNILTGEFNKLIPEDSKEINYRLAFRGGGIIGANAFALPDGTVVVTDELVRLAKNNEEILSVLLHEIGHVIHRHSLRRVISHSSLIALITVITGDLNSAGSLVVALPSVLVDSSYSRELETEADTYSLENMERFGIPRSSFADFMERLVHCGKLMADREKAEEELENDLEECEIRKTGDNESGYGGWTNYVSSHPPSSERIERFRNGKE